MSQRTEALLNPDDNLKASRGPLKTATEAISRTLDDYDRKLLSEVYRESQLDPSKLSRLSLTTKRSSGVSNLSRAIIALGPEKPSPLFKRIRLIKSINDQMVEYCLQQEYWFDFASEPKRFPLSSGFKGSCRVHLS